MSSPAEPSSFGRYTVLGRIASGGMADVYAGCVKGEAGFERVVAIKRMAVTLTQDEEFVRLFLHEAKLAAQVRSAHVVQTLDLGRTEEGTPYIVMDLVAGVTVARLVVGAQAQKLPIPPEVAISILVDSCCGLHDAHEATARDGRPLGIVHRDVSPQNILLGDDGIARVADFGIARAFDLQGEKTSARMRGKLAYFSPEQASGTTLDRRSDVFSLGIVAWEILTGTRLFRADHPFQILDRVLHQPIEEVDAVRAEVPKPVARVVKQALEREPDSRFASAEAFESALREAAHEAGLRPEPSKVASFLALCCADDLRFIDTLLSSRISWTGDHAARDKSPPSPPVTPPTDRLAITEPEPGQASTLSGAERTTEPIRLLRKRVPSNPPPKEETTRDGQVLGRRKLLRVGLAALPILAGVGTLGSLWLKGRFQATGPLQGVVRGSPPPPSSRTTLRMGTSFLTNILSSAVAPALFWSVYETDPEGRVKASFLRQIPDLENGSARILAGGRFEVSWTLLPSLRWSDGSPLTAEDLVMAHRLTANPRALEARQVDATTAVFAWNDHWAQAVDGFEALPSEVFRPVLTKGTREAALELRKNQPTPGLGPYRIVEVQVGDRMILEANPHFAGPPPSLRRVELFYRKEPGQLIEMFERNELDVIVPNAITVEQTEELRKRHPEAVHFRLSPHYVFLHPDLAHPQLASIEARRALLQALDRTSLAREIYGRPDLVAHCPAPGLASSAVATYAYDPRQAAATLARLGFGGITLPLYHSGWPMDIRIAKRLHENLVAAGLRVELTLADRVTELCRKGKHGGLVLNALRDAGPENVAAHFNLPALEAGFDRSVRHSGFDDWVASLLDREERAVQPLRRAQLRQELWVAFSERLPVLPLTFLLERVVVAPSLRGWDDVPSKRFTSDLERWFFVS